MRIVAIALTLFLLLMAVVPLLSGTLPASSAGFLVGVSAGIFVVALMLGGAAWFLSERNETAAEIGYSIGILLGIILIIGAVTHARAERIERALIAKRARTIWDPIAHTEKYLEGHPYANAPGDTDEGRSYAAIQELLRDIRESVNGLMSAEDRTTRILIDIVTQTTSREELDTYKEAVTNHERAAQECARYFTDIEAVLDERLIARGVDTSTRAKIRTEFGKGLSRNNSEILELIKRHQLMTSHVGALLDILIGDWGSWKVEPQQRKIVFKNPETRKSFDTMIGLIDESRRRVAELDPKAAELR